MLIVKYPVELFGIAAMKTDAAFGAGQQRKKTAFQYSLQVEGDIEMLPP